MVNKIINKIQEEISQIRMRADSVVEEYHNSPVYTIKNSTGSVKNYKYFIYPYKNFTESNIQNEAFIAKYMSLLIPKNIDYLVTFEADGIGIGKLISYLLNKPLIVCKPFHYHQKVISFSQKTGYFERKMYCPAIVKGKKVAIIDCMTSTGGTIKGLIKKLNRSKTKTLGVYVVVNKTNYHHEKNPFGKIPYKYLFDVEVIKKKVETKVSDIFRELFWEEINIKLMEITSKISKKSNKERNNFEVGAMVMDSDTFEILGWGKKTKYYHAEVNAIRMANRKHNITGRTLTLYTNLEPCVKRTLNGKPSCTELILNEPSIKWVVIREKDRLDKNNFNKGLKKLQKGGKYVILLETHPSRPLNYDEPLTKRKHFSDLPE